MSILRSRLAKGGMYLQWLQLYALPPEALRSLVASFLTVYPRAWLFESIPGADALLVAASEIPQGLDPSPSWLFSYGITLIRRFTSIR